MEPKSKKRPSPQSLPKKTAKAGKKASKKASSATKKVTRAVKKVVKKHTGSKLSKASTASKLLDDARSAVQKVAARTKKAAAKTGFVNALKHEAAKVTAAAEAVVEVVQEELTNAKRGAKKALLKKT